MRCLYNPNNPPNHHNPRNPNNNNNNNKPLGKNDFKTRVKTRCRLLSVRINRRYRNTHTGWGSILHGNRVFTTTSYATNNRTKPYRNTLSTTPQNGTRTNSTRPIKQQRNNPNCRTWRCRICNRAGLQKDFLSRPVYYAIFSRSVHFFCPNLNFFPKSS